MMKPKAALVKDGFLPKGSENKRGRMSGAGIERCQYLVDHEDYSIEGFAKSSASGKPASETSKPEIVRVKPESGRMLDVPDMRRDERDWTASITVDGKTVEPGFRIVCNGCGNSLGWCYEETSRVSWQNAEYVVRYSPKKGGTS